MPSVASAPPSRELPARSPAPAPLPVGYRPPASSLPSRLAVYVRFSGVLSVSWMCLSHKMEKGASLSLRPLMVTPAGFKPTTFRTGI